MKALWLVPLLMVVGLFAQASEQKIVWFGDFDKAKSEAKEEDKLLFVDFIADWCGPCKMMDRQSYPNAEVVKIMSAHYVAVRVDVDEQPMLAQQYGGNASKYGGKGIPAMIVIDSQGKEVYRHHGYLSAKELKDALESVVENGEVAESESSD